ncbi:MAG: type II secretion system minor pseudopilin GspI, partial [Sphingomonas sp.]|nr:type II secretion system minor pseudopilin GspI [Sphingomonas sp.]
MVEGDRLDAPLSGRAARPFRQALTRLPPPRERGVSGFTLIEIIVALAVFSLAALALLRLEGQTVLSARLLDETMVAQMVARNVMVEAMTDARVPPRGLTQGIEQ